MDQTLIVPKKYVYVMGIEPVNQKRLDQISAHSDFVFVPLLSYEELKGSKALSITEILEKIEQIYQMEGPFIDGIIGLWDFPVNILVSILAHKYGWSAAQPSSVVQAEHKLMCRNIIDTFAPELNPRFQGLHLHSPDEPILEYPFWVKPSLGYRGQFLYFVNNKEQYQTALEKIEAEIDRFAEPFTDLVYAAGLTFQNGILDGYTLVLEENIDGHQCAVEGYVYRGTTNVISIFDSKNDSEVPSLARHQYPSSLPQVVQERLGALACKVIESLEYGCGCFNIEFFWNDKTDEIKLLEVHTRVSQAHADIVSLVDGCSNLRMAADIAIDRPPRVAYRRGLYNIAAQFLWRSKEDAVIERIPSFKEIESIKQQFPHMEVNIKVKRGDRLSQLLNQDTFSYILAEAQIGAYSESELLERYERFIKQLKELLILRPLTNTTSTIYLRDNVVRDLFP